ncbi:MAG: NADH-quinone oxidoreductase subunit J, partial [Candidatus Omnitrophota bacterium]|nr:NADH-quinone oxidoreductase subunit J [Candidatus Omnitrophota bacterium]
ILIKVIAKAAWQPVVAAGPVISLPELGRSLMSKYALPFEVISLISLAALIGAIAIGKSQKK